MGSTDGAAQRRARFRDFVRRHHPDAGGDPAVFIAGLAQFRAGRFQTGEFPGGDERYDAPVVFLSGRQLAVARAQRLWRRIRPGHPRVH